MRRIRVDSGFVALVVVVMMTIAACTDDPTPTPTTPDITINLGSSAAGSTKSKCGGPTFAYAEKGQKGAVFAETSDLFVARPNHATTVFDEISIGATLTYDLLKRSAATHADRTQTYNYVIDARYCEIYVAVFREQNDIDRALRALVDADLCSSSIGTQKMVQGMMVNFHGEPGTKHRGLHSSPCMLKLNYLGYEDEGKIKQLGILDAVSKHLMLAQPLGKKSLGGLDPRTLDTQMVAYAGEIERWLRKTEQWG